MDPHPATDDDGDLANHLHGVHHRPLREVQELADYALELAHSDDHYDMRRGIHG